MTTRAKVFMTVIVGSGLFLAFAVLTNHLSVTIALMTEAFTLGMVLLAAFLVRAFRRSRIHFVITLGLVVFVAASIPLCLGLYDSKRITSHERPVFSLKMGVFGDGGSVSYLGWGYVLTQVHALDDQEDGTGRVSYGHNVGYELRLWFWPPIRHVQFEPTSKAR